MPAWEINYMKVIVVNSQKGGSGKTMLTKHLAIEAERAGDGPVYMIDNDPQASLSTWYARRDLDKPTLVEVPFGSLAAGLEHLKKQGAQFVFIDTASGRLEIAAEIFQLVDFVIFPAQDTQDDIDAAPRAVQQIKAAGIPFVFALTRVKPNTLITAQATAAYSKHGQIAETFIADRASYKSSYQGGRTITEVEPNGAAAKEIAALWRSIKLCLHENMQNLSRKVVVNA
jgi:chromosome partitioning protein